MDTALKILQVLIPIALGWGFRLLELFGDEEAEVFRRLVVRFTLPVLVFFSMYDAGGGEIGALPPMILAFVALSAALFLVGWLCSRIVKGAGQKTAVHACTTFGNYGWMGFGVCQVLLGQAGFRRAVFFSVLWWPVFYGLGLPIGMLHAGGRRCGVPLKKVLGVALPVLAAVGLGLGANLGGVAVPGFLQQSLRPFGDMTVPLILFSVGLGLDLTRVPGLVVPALVVSAATLLVGPLIGVGVAALSGADPISRSTIIMESAMPVATMTPILAENYEMDLDMVGTCIVVSTLLSMITVPLLATFLLG